MGNQRTIILDTSIFDDEGPDKSHASLIVLKGAEIGRDFRLRKTSMVIGRESTADICLPDDGASRAHARIDFEGSAGDAAAFSLTDLASTNQTFVNGEQIASVQLRDGDKIQIGGTVLKFVVLDSVEARFHAAVRELISYDQLTGLLTKESLYLAFERELKRCLRYNLPVAVLMMDLDRFKSVNDTHGHLMGSHVLSEVGRIIQRCIRVADVSARYGGEEFVAYLAETDAQGAHVVAERIRRDMETFPFVLDGTTIQVKISIGISIAPEHGETVTGLVGAADKALYRAKETGRNRVCVAPSSASTSAE
jgi:diguanylate cyclase (GGDEF)-like protein